MPRPGIVHIDIPGDLQTDPENLVLFLVIPLLALGDHAMQLARGNPHSPFTELLENERLGHLRVVVLVEHEAAQGRAEVRCVALKVHLSGEQLAIGSQPLLLAVESRHSFDDQLLHKEVIVTLEATPLGNILGLDHLRLIDPTRFNFFAFALLSILLLFLPHQLRGTNFRLWLLFLQPSDLVTQCLHLFPHLVDQFAQLCIFSQQLVVRRELCIIRGGLRMGSNLRHH